MRLKGFDYSQPGEYFVTICTTNRLCVLGDVVDGEMMLSDAGKIVEACWKTIPRHFPGTRARVFQVMPNHVHGIVEILHPRNAVDKSSPNSRKPSNSYPFPNSCTGLINQHPKIRGGHSCRGGVTPPQEGDETSPLQKFTVGNVVGYFKYRATKFINEANGSPGTKVFQRNYFDHIIRSDPDHFCIERYIELNPLLWYLDSDNPAVDKIPYDELKQKLKEDHDLDEHAIAYLLDRESDYRSWQETGS